MYWERVDRLEHPENTPPNCSTSVLYLNMRLTVESPVQFSKHEPKVVTWVQYWKRDVDMEVMAEQFGGVFSGCSSLSTLSQYIFYDSTEVKYVAMALLACSSLDPVILLSAENITVTSYFAYGCASTCDLYLHMSEDTDTYQYFSEDDTANVTITLKDS